MAKTALTTIKPIKVKAKVHKTKSVIVKGKRGGLRPGSGRPPGTKNPETIQREMVAERLRQRTYQVADRLFDSQLSLARGQAYLYRIDKVWTVPPSGKGGFWKNKKPVMETDPEVIACYLNGDYDGNSEDDGGASYFFITTKEPNSQTIDSILNRALGSSTKAPDDMDPNDNVKQIIIVKNYGRQND